MRLNGRIIEHHFKSGDPEAIRLARAKLDAMLSHAYKLRDEVAHWREPQGPVQSATS